MEQIQQQILDLRNQLNKLQNLQSKNDIVSVNGLMEWLEISRPTIHRWKEKGILKAYNLGGKLFFKRSEVLESLESNKNIIS